MDGQLPEKKLRVARYLRVSRQDQNPQLQADETLAFISKKGWELTDTYLDQGISGARADRPELQRLLEDARRHRWDVILVWKSDRLFRSLRHMVNTLDELTSLGVAFASTTEVFDTTSAQGRLLLHLVSAMAEFERSLISDRTRAALAAVRRQGRRLGRPPVIVDLVRARVLRQEGKSLRTIAATLGCGLGTLCRALKESEPRVPEQSLAGTVQESEPTALVHKPLAS